MEMFFIVSGIMLLTLLVNIPLGMWRETVKKFSIAWFVAVHASIPLVVTLRIWLDVSNWYIPVLISVAILGQFIGARLMRNRNAIQKVKKLSNKPE